MPTSAPAWPKAKPWPPRWLAPARAPRRTDGPAVAEFVETFCRIDKDTLGGQRGDLVVLRPWQQRLLDGLFAVRPDGRRQFRQALIGVPRKNGKSCLASGIGLFGLFTDVEGAEVYSVAGDKDQARIVFGTAKKMVESDPELSELVVVYKDALEVPSTQSIYRVLSNVADLKEGLNPTLVVFDEVHVQPNDELWSVMRLAGGARRNFLMLGITTAGVMTDNLGADSLCYRLYQHGRNVAQGLADDPYFYFAWWEPKAGLKADHTNPKVWAECNPGFGDLVDPEDFVSVLPPQILESEFRTKRTNLFVGAKEPWLPAGAWDDCKGDEPAAPDGSRIILGFDGSFSRDCTALVGATVSETPHLFVVQAWERPVGGDESWRVDIAEAEDAIRAACRRWDVAEVDCDPFRWQQSMQTLQKEGIPIVEWPTTSAKRMVPACARFRDAVVERTLTHDGDQRLARHVANCVVKTDSLGPRIVKDHKNSPRKIDLAVAAVVAYDRATQQPAKKRPKIVNLAAALAEAAERERADGAST